ncbi:myotubularin-related protein 10-A-like, partial [Mustelus asterias]
LCLKKASEVSSLLSAQCLTVTLQETDDRDLACLVSSLVQVTLDPYCRTMPGFQSLIQKEWVEAGHRFSDRFNRLRTTDKDESAVFLLFLDCVWELLEHYPVLFEFTDTYLLAIRDSTHIPLFQNFLFNCPRERAYAQQSLATDLRARVTPFTNGWPRPRSAPRGEQVVLKGGFFTREERSCPLPSVWDWSLQFPLEHRALFRSALYSSDAQLPAQNGTSAHSNTDKVEFPLPRTVYHLTRGVLLVQPQLLPWKNVSVSKKLSRLSQSLESLLELEQPQRIPLSPSLDPASLPLPPIPAPGIRLWRGCYLRWPLEVGFEAAYDLLTALTSQVHWLEQRLRQEADRQNAATSGLDHQGNHIAQPPRPVCASPVCPSGSGTMETSFTTMLSSATL